MDNHYRKDAGDQGEARALQYLLRAGLQLLDRNYRCKAGEIDLIMRDTTTLVFVEVRYRRASYFGGAAGSVNQQKQRKLLHAAQHYLQTHPDLRRQRARFDLIAIDGDALGKLEWIKDAFRQ